MMGSLVAKPAVQPGVIEMAVDYSGYRVHPTRYRGTMFRSRLEATWAAMFDGLGWRWEYEPFDLNGWVPDFLLNGNGRDILVEVKPVLLTDRDVEAKITNAAQGYDAHLMICGRKPFHENETYVLIAMSCKNECGYWGRRAIVQAIDTKQYDIVTKDGYGFCSGRRIGMRLPLDEFMGREVDALWARAKNATQWHPRYGV